MYFFSRFRVFFSSFSEFLGLFSDVRFFVICVDVYYIRRFVKSFGGIILFKFGFLL